MTEMTNINGKEVELVEYIEQRVISTEQLADFYGVEANHIRNSFFRNKDKFVEGIHYFILASSDLGIALNDTQGSFSHKSFWTKKDTLTFKRSGIKEAYSQLMKDAIFIKETLNNYQYRHPVIKSFRIKKCELGKHIQGMAY